MLQHADGKLAEFAPVVIPRIDLNLLMLYLEIVNSGSITQTASRLRTPKATLSRKLRQLEQQIGAVLLKRGSHRLEMTEIGQALFTHCERIALEAENASAIASEMQSQLKGQMRISIPFGLGNTWISQALARFAREYPDVKLTIHVTNRWVDVSEEPYEVAIYIGKVRNEQLPAKCLAELARGVYVSPAYLARRGRPQAPIDLLMHDCIALESQIADGVWTFQMPGGDSVTANPRVMTTDVVVAREMALAGLGCVVLTHALSEPDVKAGNLVRILESWRITPVPVTATFLERRHLPQRVRAFIDLIAEEIQLRRSK